MNHARLSDSGGSPAPVKGHFWERLKTFGLRDTNVVIISVILANLFRAISSVVLTRLLMPEAFGVAGLIGSIWFTINMLSDLGFQGFVVRHPDGDNPRFLDTVWTIAVLRSVVLTIAMVVAAPAIAGLFGKHELAPIFIVSAFAFLIDGAASLTLITALRNRMILRLSLLELGVLGLQILLSFVLAYLWRNYWAMLVSIMVSNMVKTLLSYLVFPNSVRKPAFDKRYVGDLLHFARYVTGSSIITLLLLQTDKLVLARMMSLDHFGFYILAGSLAGAPHAFTSAYSSRVLLPYYSQAWRDGSKNLRALYYAKRRIPSLIHIFATGGLIGCAPLVVAVLYDPRYATAALYLQILLVSVLFALASNSAGEALTAAGRFEVPFQSNVAKLVWFGIAGPVGYVFGGVVGLVVAVGLMEVPATIFKWFHLHRLGLLDLRQELIFLSVSIPGYALGFAADRLISPLLN